MSKVVPRRCLRGYRHYFLVEDVTWDEPDDDHAQMREILFVCARCSYHWWVDSTIRPFLGLKSDDDWPGI